MVLVLKLCCMVLPVLMMGMLWDTVSPIVVIA
jgi:hypothetical protein